jgi:hypothetical protein
MQSASDRNFLSTSFIPSDLHNGFKGPQDAILARVPQFLSPVTTLPDLKSDSPSNTLNFQIPQYDGAIDSRTVRLHLKLSVDVTAFAGLQGWIRLDNAGWGAAISQINLFESNMLIEQITDVGNLIAMLNQTSPQDYIESVLKVTESTNYVEEQVPYEAQTSGAFAVARNYPMLGEFNNRYGPVAQAGGKYLMLFKGPADGASNINFAASSFTTSASINLPLGMFNTNRPIHSYMLNGLRLEIIFNPIKSFLVWPTDTYGAIATTSVKITSAELRYDLLSLSTEYRSGMLELVRELGSFEYPMDSYRMSTNFLGNNSGVQIVKISASGGSLLQSITFGFIQQAPTAPNFPTQSMFVSAGLESYHFKLGGIRIPNQDIYTLHGTTPIPTNEGTGLTYAEDNSDSFIETIKAQNMYKAYALGATPNSRKVIEGPYASLLITTNPDRRLYTYSFMQSYDQESAAGLTLLDNSEISLVLNFKTAPGAGSRCIVALNYGVKHIFTSSGQSILQS